MKRALILAALLSLSITYSADDAFAAEAAVGDTAASIKDETLKAPVRKLSACLWENDHATAIKLSTQYQLKSEKFSFPPQAFSKCGGDEAIKFASANIYSLGGDVNLIRTNQLARCAIKRNKLKIVKALEDLAASDSVPKFLADTSQKTKIMAILVGANKHLPDAVIEVIALCDLPHAAFVDSEGIFRSLLAEEIAYEATR